MTASRNASSLDETMLSLFLQVAGETVELVANSLSLDNNQLSSSEPGGSTKFLVRMVGVTVELTTSMNALPAMREARKVLPAEDDEDDGGDEADAFPQPTDDADDGTEKVDAIPQPIDTEDDAEAVLGAEVAV